MTDKSVYRVWRQASVRLPDGSVRHRQLVFVTSDGLELFDKPGEPSWTSPVLFERTAEPRGKRTHVGIDIATEEGVAVVTPTGGCMSCGSRMRGWYPEGYQTVTAWPSSAVSPT